MKQLGWSLSLALLGLVTCESTVSAQVRNPLGDSNRSPAATAAADEVRIRRRDAADPANQQPRLDPSAGGAPDSKGIYQRNGAAGRDPRALRDPETNPPRPGERTAANPVPLVANPAPPAGSPPTPPAPPFQLTPQEQAVVDNILTKWEQHSAGVKTLSCNFRRYQYHNDELLLKDQGYKFSESDGQIQYQAPDRGSFEVTKEKVWDQNKKAYTASDDVLDHWVCDGKSIFIFQKDVKELKELPIAKELQGQAITQSPLPFVFGAKAEDLKKRYFIRKIDMSFRNEPLIALEIHPRYQADAANFSMVTFAMTQDFKPFGMEIYATSNNKNDRESFQFTKIEENARFWGVNITAPKAPWGWKHVVDNGGGVPPSAQPPLPPGQPAQPPAQAQRPGTGPR